MRNKSLTFITLLTVTGLLFISACGTGNENTADASACDAAIMVAFEEGASSEQIIEARNAVDAKAREAFGDSGWRILLPSTQLEGGVTPPTVTFIVDASTPSGDLMLFYKSLTSTPQAGSLRVAQVLLEPTAGENRPCEPIQVDQ